MDSLVLSVLLLVVGAVLFLVVQDWFGSYIAGANPLPAPQGGKA